MGCNSCGEDVEVHRFLRLVPTDSGTDMSEHYLCRECVNAMLEAANLPPLPKEF